MAVWILERFVCGLYFGCNEAVVLGVAEAGIPMIPVQGKRLPAQTDVWRSASARGMNGSALGPHDRSETRVLTSRAHKTDAHSIPNAI